MGYTLPEFALLPREAYQIEREDKEQILKAFDADIFFDYQQKLCDSARQHVATGHVPHGVENE